MQYTEHNYLRFNSLSQNNYLNNTFITHAHEWNWQSYAHLLYRKLTCKSCVDKSMFTLDVYPRYVVLLFTDLNCTYMHDCIMHAHVHMHCILRSYIMMAPLHVTNWLKKAAIFQSVVRF